MSKKIFSIKTLLAFCAVVCLSLATGFISNPKQMTAKADEETTYVSDVSKVEYFYNENRMLIFFTNTDYMTAAEWSEPDNYKWVNQTLAFEDRETANVCNAAMDKNLDAYNLGEYILIDDVPLSNYTYELTANSLTRVQALGISVDGDAMRNAQKITLKEGCTIPTLYHSYFGVEEYSEIVVQEGVSFIIREGIWAKQYAFDGYETDVRYDANDRFFYLRNLYSKYKGHAEAPTYEFTNIFSVNGWGDDGYTIATTPDTEEGRLAIFDLVHPINANEYGLIYLRFFSNVPRSFITLNPKNITETDFGPALESFSIPGGGFTTVALLAPLYADENGMINSFVVQFTESGSDNYELNQFFLGSFEFEGDVVYNESFLIENKEDSYDVTFRFNKCGEFNKKIALDKSKVLFNGVSIDEINAEGDYATAKWESIQGVYQIKISLSKEYQGAAQIKNPELAYAGNSMTVVEGLQFPNGEILDTSYSCGMYRDEKIVSSELMKGYKETKLVDIEWLFDDTATNNIHMRFNFDVALAAQPYYHADQTEIWRDAALPVAGLYDGAMTQIYLNGGFKSSLYDNVLINGKTLGEWHAIDEYPTCVFVHYAQVTKKSLEVSIDSNSEIYQTFKTLFESGEGVTIEIKAGLKFLSGVRTEKDCKFVLQGGEFVLGGEQSGMCVYYNGKAVSQGDMITTQTEASMYDIAVEGVKGFAVDMLRNGDMVEFIIKTVDGQKFSFAVKEDIVILESNADDGAGMMNCQASICSGALMGGACWLMAAIPVLLRRKKDEE